MTEIKFGKHEKISTGKAPKYFDVKKMQSQNAQETKTLVIIERSLQNDRPGSPEAGISKQNSLTEIKFEMMMQGSLRKLINVDKNHPDEEEKHTNET